MKLFAVTLCGLAFLALSSTKVLAKGWTISPAAAEQRLKLSFGADQSPTYLFVCGGADIRITNFGVTELMDMQTGKKIEDAPGSVMTPGASFMALFTGKGDPDFVPAEAVPNAVKGWDMTIRLGKSDKQIKALGKADMISLFTTGYTMAVELDSEDKVVMRDFLKQCPALK